MRPYDVLSDMAVEAHKRGVLAETEVVPGWQPMAIIIAFGMVWALFSIIQALQPLFAWLLLKGNAYAAMGSLLVAVLGAAGYSLFQKAPRVFGALQIIVSIGLGSYFGYRLSGGETHALEQMANIAGAIFLFIDGARHSLKQRLSFDEI